MTRIDLPVERWTLVELVREQAKRYGDRTFLSMKDGREISFAELDRRSTELATGFAKLGVSEGDRVFSMLLNSVELLETLIGVNKRKALFVTINTELRAAFLEHQLRNSAPRVVVVHDELVPAFAGVEADDLEIETVVVVGDGDVELAGPLAGKELVRFEDLLGSDAAGVEEPSPHDVSTVMYTSGTTGPSKGVLMPHAHCILMGWELARVMELTDDDVYFNCMPLFHTNALFMQTIGSLLCGTRLRLVRRFSPSSWLDDVRECGATVTNALGVMPEFLFRQEPRPDDADNPLRYVMAVPIAEEWGRAFEERFGVRIVQGFGMTECNIVAYTTPADPLVAGCAGRILDEWFEVRVVDPETDAPVPAGNVGEIVVRPKRPGCFMAGYFRMPEKTVEAWRNLWFHSGDAGRFDEEGRLFFVDRIKDCIRRRGENISSYEVEQVLNDHPAIAESAVVGIRTADAGGEEEVKACLVVSGEKPAPESLLDYCQTKMPRYAVPRFLEFVDEIPKTQTGKIQKAALREAGVTAATWDRETVGYVLRR